MGTVEGSVQHIVTIRDEFWRKILKGIYRTKNVPRKLRKKS